MENQPTTTCQICARHIKASSGIIAHHGYQRPGTGWQTSSCLGARELPYEVSRDAIPGAITRYQGAKEFNEKHLQELLTTPPATLSGAPARNGDTATYERPEGFDAKDNVDPEGYHYRSDGYSRRHYTLVRETRGNIEALKGEIERLQQRYDNWQAA